MKNACQMIAGLLSLSLVVACGGPQTGTTTPAPQGGAEPDWVGNPIKGCAPGSAKNRGIRDLARKAAIASARDELTRQLKVTVQGMIKAYKAMVETGGKDFAEEDTRSVTRQVVDQTMVGTRTVKTQLLGKEMYALVCLDPDTFAKAFEQMNKADEKMRAALKQRAEKEFHDLDTQLEKLKAR